ncbi:MAG TPA: hypothetical protein VLF89_05960 [Candidatus Saccharimonadales bacterium]|nr:hypothetical protein [Candidatus Saccharimonadales bacterium]
MHNLFAGLLGLFASIGTFFHGGQPAQQPMMNVYMNTTATPSGSITPGYGKGGQGRMNTNGERPFFGTVTAVNGSTITIEMQGFMRMMRSPDDSVTPTITITPAQARTITITVNSSTTYTGGSFADITTGTKIAGIGKTTSDTAITATKISINPTIPSGAPPGMIERGMHSNGNGPQGGFQTGGGQGYGAPQR